MKNCLAIIGMIGFISCVVGNDPDKSCSRDEKGKISSSCLNKSPAELFQYCVEKLQGCAEGFKGQSKDLENAAKYCSKDADSNKSFDCYVHCIGNKLEPMTEVDFNGKTVLKEDNSVVHGIFNQYYPKSTADAGFSIFARCKALLPDDPFFPKMKQCEELNGFHRCIFYNLFKQQKCEITKDDHQFFGVLDLAKLNLSERRKRK